MEHFKGMFCDTHTYVHARSVFREAVTWTVEHFVWCTVLYVTQFQSGQHSGRLRSDLAALGTVVEFSVWSVTRCLPVRSAFREAEK